MFNFTERNVTKIPKTLENTKSFYPPSKLNLDDGSSDKSIEFEKQKSVKIK